MSNEVLTLSKALGDETRFSIYKFITTQTQPVSVEDLAGKFELHPNAIRLHLTKLEKAGLVSVEFARGEPGRPKRLYSANREMNYLPFGKRDYKFWGFLLLDFLANKDISPSELNSFGKKWGYSYIQAKLNNKPESLENILQSLLDEFKDWGFEPELVSLETPKVEINLKNCAFKEMAKTQPALVCSLVDGLAEGILSAFIGKFKVQINRGLVYGENCCVILLELKNEK